MTGQLRDLLEQETAHLEGRVDPSAAWAEAVRRRRSRAAVSVAVTAAAVALLVGVVTWATLPGDSPKPAPADPSPSVTPPPDVVDGMGTPVERDQVLPVYDPAEWQSLPEYPGDLGWWASPDRPVPLADDPVTRATAAVQVMLGSGQANVWVYGDDGRWRSLDTSGLDLVDNGDYRLGLGRGSLSPDGTRLAVGQAEGVVVVDLTTAETRTYPLADLGEVWTGRATYWTPDGDAVLLGRSWAALGEPLAYTKGWRVDVGDGSVTRARLRPGVRRPPRGRNGDRRLLERTQRPRVVSVLDDAGSRTSLGEIDAYLGPRPAQRARATGGWRCAKLVI